MACPIWENYNTDLPKFSKAKVTDTLNLANVSTMT